MAPPGEHSHSACVLDGPGTGEDFWGELVTSGSVGRFWREMNVTGAQGLRAVYTAFPGAGVFSK